MIVGFLIMGILTYYTYTDEPPIPQFVNDSKGLTLFTRADIMAGQGIVLGNGLMEYGSIFGHGAYLGPDFTTEYLHRAALSSNRIYSETTIVFIPEGKIAWGKLSQSMDYGAMTMQLKTDFDGCVRILTELVTRFPIYLLNSVNPYRLEGQKTPAFEILEQLDWQVPEHIVVPGGNLANSSALGKGFLEMHQLGLIPRAAEDQHYSGGGGESAVSLVHRLEPR